MKKFFSVIVGIALGLVVSIAVGYTLKSISSTTNIPSLSTRTSRFSGARNGLFGSGRARFGSGMSGAQFSGARMGSGFFRGMGRNGTGNFVRGSGAMQGMGRGKITGNTSDPQQLLDQNILQK